MNFGSKFVYNYSEEEEEEYDLDDDGAADQAQNEKRRKRRWRRADTNVLSVRFDHLASPSDMHTGDPIHCDGCNATLSHISTLTDQTWTCEFCGKTNHVDVSVDEICKGEDVTFMIQPSANTMDISTEGKKPLTSADGPLVVFCVDVSGSMSSDTRVPGRLDLFHSGSTRIRYQESRNITLVSRLEAVQVAVSRQVEEIAETSPETRVALVAFHSQVTAIGDGSLAAPLTFHGGQKNEAELKAMGRDLPLPQSAGHAKFQLVDKVCSLRTQGSTALGPALLLSVAMASQVPGSKVIICTDGMANVGLGSLRSFRGGGAAYDEATQFYNDTATYASENGVSISVITFEGTDCRLAELGHVAAQTEGHVDIVDPMKLTEEFGNILIDRTIATDVTATFVLHHGLYVRNEENLPSKVTKQFGNVSKDTEITFEYGVRRQKKPAPNDKPKVDPEENQAKDESKPAEEPMSHENIEPAASDAGPSSSTAQDVPAGTSESSTSSVDNLKELPFQLQITYTDMEGARAMRVITKKKPITKQREKAEEHLKARVMLTHATKMNADLALQGQYKEARMNFSSHGRILQRNAVSKGKQKAHKDYLSTNEALCGDLNRYEQQERAAHGRTLSDSEGSDDEQEEKQQVFKLKAKKKSVIAQRQQQRGDGSSKNIFKNLKKAFKPTDYSDEDD